MFKTVFLLALFSLQAHALSLERLRAPLIKEGNLGPLSVEQIETLEVSLRELGRPDYFWLLQEELNTENSEEISSFIHACNLEGNTLGAYQSGRTKTYLMARIFEISPENTPWNQDILEEAKKSYRSRVRNEGSHVSLIIQEKPFICLRAGMSLGQTLITFVHEATHLLQNKGESWFSVDESEKAYIEKRYAAPGGEKEAFKAGIKIQKQLAQEYGFYEATRGSRFFDGERFNEAGLKSHVLNELGYRQKFKDFYRRELQGAYNNRAHELKSLEAFKEIYEQNLKIGERNLEVARSRSHKDVSTYLSWIDFYQDLIQKSSDFQRKVQVELEKLKIRMEEMSPFQKHVIFTDLYSNMI